MAGSTSGETRDSKSRGYSAYCENTVTDPSASTQTIADKVDRMHSKSDESKTFDSRKDSGLSIYEPDGTATIIRPSILDEAPSLPPQTDESISASHPNPQFHQLPPASVEAGTQAHTTDQPVEVAKQTEQALTHCFALAAAVTTWCLLQPLIFFFAVEHFQSFQLSRYTGQIVLPIFMLSILVGLVLGPKAAFAVVRITETGEPPSRIRARLYALVLGLTTLMASMPVLLLFGSE